MSSHHTRKFFLTKYDQQDAAKVRRQERLLKRQAIHEAEVKEIHRELLHWHIAEAVVYLGILLSFVAVAEWGIWGMFR